MIKKILRPFYIPIIKVLHDVRATFRQHSDGRSDAKKWFINEMSFFRSHSSTEKKGILLMQLVKDYEYTLKMAAASKVIADKEMLSICFYDVDWMKWLGRNNRISDVYGNFFSPYLNKLHLSFGEKILFKNEDRFKDQAFIKTKLLELKSKLNETSDILNIAFENVLVGDLIYDSYLRYFHQPTITALNKDVLLIIEVALNIFYNFNELLENNEIKCLVNTYTSYLEHGIPARLCLSKDIPVYTVGSNSYVVKKVDKLHPYHAIDHWNFSPDKPLSTEQLEIARKAFVSRFEGKIDPAVSYMRQSSFQQTPIDEKLKISFAEKKRNAVLYIHDFYDSPHINRQLLFPDLFQFLKQTLEAIVDIKDTNVFIKTHPNGLAGVAEKTIELVKELNNPSFQILDNSVSNKHIAELKPDLIVTARGTVASEMAYFGIPVVALYDNIYANFKFAHTCFETATYYAIIKGDLEPEIDFDKQKIFSFYYQASLEQMEGVDEEAFKLLRSFNGNTYNDKYIDTIKAHKSLIFSDKFLDSYRSKIYSKD